MQHLPRYRARVLGPLADHLGRLPEVAACGNPPHHLHVSAGRSYPPAEVALPLD